MSADKGGDLAKYVGNSSELLTSGNYNEVDGLVFASISYVKFESESVRWTREELENGVTLQQFAQKVLDGNKNGGEILSQEEEALLSAIMDSPRYSKCRVTDLAACDGTSMWDAGRRSELQDDAQWGAMTINMEDGTDSAVVAMRGTNGTRLGWEEDFELGYEPEGTTAQQLSKQYLEATDEKKIYLTGHSKGGNDVSSAYMMSSRDVRNRVVSVNNYDGPGHNPEFIDGFKEAYKELSQKQNNYYPKNSVIGQLLNNNPGSAHFVNADIVGHTQDMGILGEHDGYSWELTDGYGGFSETSQSELSKVIDRVLDSSLSGLSASERTTVLRALIDIGVPSLLADNKNKDGTIEINASTWDSILQSVLKYKVGSLGEMWALLKLVHSLITELGRLCIVKTVGFIIPGYDDFYYWVRDIYGEVFRKFKNAAEDIWGAVWNGVKTVYNVITGNESNDNKNSEPIYDFTDKNQGLYSDSIINMRMFRINVDKIEKCGDSIQQIASQITRIIDEIDDVGNALPIIGNVSFSIQLKKVKEQINTNKKMIEQMNKALVKACGCYKSSEQLIIASIG